MDFTTADLYDSHTEEVLVPELQWLAVGAVTRFSGRIATLKLFEDNSLVREAFAEAGNGRVLVIDGGGSLRRALIGDQLAAKGLANGWVGAVVRGCVRDRAILDGLDFGIRCLGTHPRKTDKRGQGERDVELEMGGVQVSPGDWAYADEDGVLFAKRSLLA